MTRVTRSPVLATLDRPPPARLTRDCWYVDLYWLPLGAGGHSVRCNGLAYEAVAARLDRRERCDLFHSALEVRVAQGRHVIEMAPVWSEPAGDRGVVGEGAVRSRLLGVLRAFRYEIRCWPDGRIPTSPTLSTAPSASPRTPPSPGACSNSLRPSRGWVWGRGETHAGEMWNSNSVTAWLLARSAIDVRLAHFRPVAARPDGMPGLALATAAPRPRRGRCGDRP